MNTQRRILFQFQRCGSIFNLKFPRLLSYISKIESMTIIHFTNNTVLVMIKHSQSIQILKALQHSSKAINYDMQNDKYA